MNVVKGKLKPLRDNVLVTDMSFEEQTTASGIIIQSDDGETRGVTPRWCRVWAIGPQPVGVKVGEWIYVEHGRWTRGVKIEEDGVETTIRRVDTAAILLQAEEPPSDIYLNRGIDVPEAVEAYRLENK